MIDVLRWTTTAVTALANGASAIEAFAEPEEARERAARIGALTAGERGGHRIAGFDLGNSPLEFTAARVAGRTICATTSNGTRALLATVGATQRYLAGFVNLRATAAAILARSPAAADLVCAGTEGRPSAEDSACAEALAAVLRGEAFDPELLARAARAPHAAFLRGAGYASDVDVALTPDSVQVVALAETIDGVTRVTRRESRSA